MRTVSLAAVAVFTLTLAELVFSQQPAVPILSAPPTVQPAPLIEPPPAVQPVVNADPVPLPGGTDVSQPLQPGVIVPQATEGTPLDGFTEIVPGAKPKPGQILGKWWDTDELLIWWPKAHPVPPLVTATRLGAPPVLGRPDTLTLVGNRAIDNQDIAGYRLLLGHSLNDADTVGIEGGYFFLGTRTVSTFVTDLGDPRYKAIGLPFVNALTGDEDVLTLTHPGVTSALVTAYTTTRVQGAEVNAVANLYASKGVKLHGLAGYRFLQVHEGLRVETDWLQYASPATLGHTTIAEVADQFSAHNRFSGGQVGLYADLVRGPVFVELTGKVALGRNFEVVKVEGQTNLITGIGNTLPLLRSYPGGVYAQPTNMGRVTHSAFAVVPEGTFKIGLKAGRSRLYVGYNFLYLSDAVRPGDQIDRRVNPTQISLTNPGARLAGPDFPRVEVNRSDFWVQGLVFGFEGRY